MAIDTLRAATSTAAALANGAESVWPVAEVQDARSLSQRMPGALLCGERAMRPPKGFDLGNSPIEYTAERVDGRTLVLCTTNGTLAIARAASARAVAFASIATAHLAASWLRRDGGPAVIVMAGTGGEFAHEDALAAGAIVAALEDVDADDLLLTARAAYIGAAADLPAELGRTPHGRRLAQAGFARDIEIAARERAFGALPVRDEAEPRRLIAWRG